MKYLPLLAILLIFQPVHSQEDSIDAATEFMLEQFKWDIQSNKRGTMMYLDLPFEYNSKTEYVTLSVAKDSGKATPEFISVILPDIVDTLNGFFIGFTFAI